MDLDLCNIRIDKAPTANAPINKANRFFMTWQILFKEREKNGFIYMKSGVYYFKK
jgi:hypothetical protein